MNKRSGLADSPFFTAPDNREVPANPPTASLADPVPGVPPVRGVLDVRDELPGLPVRPAKRIRRRHPFDIYEDQLERLKELKTRAMRRGEEASMSRMVREALDAYLDKNA